MTKATHNYGILKVWNHQRFQTKIKKLIAYSFEYKGFKLSYQRPHEAIIRKRFFIIPNFQLSKLETPNFKSHYFIIKFGYWFFGFEI